MKNLSIYGLAHCDTTKAAMKWLKEHDVNFTLHDYKVSGITKTALQDWVKQVPLEKLLNKQSTTWRSLSPQEQQTAATEAGAIELMLQHTSLIKRPVLQAGNKILAVGFKADHYAGVVV